MFHILFPNKIKVQRRDPTDHVITTTKDNQLIITNSIKELFQIDYPFGHNADGYGFQDLLGIKTFSFWGRHAPEIP